MSYRELCTTLIKRRLPKFEPQGDFDLLATGFSNIKDTPENVRKWVDAFYDYILHREFHGNKRALEHLVAAKLDAHTDVTGLKPSPGGDGVVIKPIPNTAYSLRIWPGSRFRAEYCVDFVIGEGDTITPINTPTGFEIWLVFPHYIRWEPVRIASFDRALSTTATLAQGVEKYVLRDGEKCSVMRGNASLLTFEIPERPRLDPPARCLAGTCTGEVDKSEINALDLDSTLYYNVAPSV